MNALILVAAAALVAGCAAPPTRTYTPSYSPPPEPANTTWTHEYQVKVVDVDGAPLVGATVKLSAESKSSTPRSEDCVTDAQGACPPFKFEVNRDATLRYVTSYMSSFTAAAEKSGYYAKKGSGFSTHGSSTSVGSISNPVQTVTVRMIKPIDYLEDSLVKSAADADLRGRVLTFLDAIRVQGFLNEAEVMLKGIGVSEFKGKKYLRVKVNSTSTFNSLKLNKYDVGKRLFDDTVRKMLNPLNDAIAAPRAFHGYDLVVYGHSKSFADKDAKADKLEFRFLMPEASVRKYKEKDISGQALLDASVLLLDDERIDMKLQ